MNHELTERLAKLRRDNATKREKARRAENAENDSPPATAPVRGVTGVEYVRIAMAAHEFETWLRDSDWLVQIIAQEERSDREMSRLMLMARLLGDLNQALAPYREWLEAEGLSYAIP